MAEKETLRDIESVYPLSPMQDGMLFHSLYAQDSAVYVEQLVCTLSGRLDPAIFQESWEMVVRHHPILRTSFAWKNAERMHQVVHKRVTLPFVFEDWSGWAEAEKQRRFDVVKAADHRTGFVLDKAPLMRLGLYRWGELSWRFIWTHHHLLLDGWSLPLILKEFCATYQSLERGTEPSINHCRPFKEYISWCSRQNLSSAEGFWRKTLAGVSTPTRLGVNRVSLEIAGDHGEQCKGSVFLSHEETRVIQEFCKREHLTINTLIQGAYALLLSRYCGEEDVVYGITTSGRPDVFPDAENMIGLFINTLPLRVHVSAQTPLRELLRRIQNDVVEMRQYEYSPLAKVQGWSNVPRGVPLFHSIFVFENYPLDPSLLDDLGAVKVTDVEAAGGTNYPLTLVAAVRGRLSLEIVYGEVFFAPETIKRMLGHLHRLLSEIVNCPENTAGNLTIVTSEERDNLVNRWNDTDVSFPDANIPVHAMFERCVASAADSTALQYQGQTMSYGELNRRANNVAHFLHELGVRRESLVGLCCERSFDMIVGLMGIVKAGAGYVPLDPEYPRERLAFMLADAEVKYLVTHRSLERLLPRECDVIVRLDGDWETIQHAGDENLPISVLPENVAYVIYTSGSTGRPKGVLVAHRGLSNFVCAQRSWLGIDGSARILQFASLGFDASASEIFATLTSGGRLQLVSPELVRSPEELSEFLISERTTFITLPPTFLALLKEKDFPDLRCVISAGEACPVELVPRWSRGRRFVNAYGPTETTIGATWNSEEGSSSGGSTVPIGRPMPNIKVYLLDRFLHPVPVGVEGELYIAGIGVSRGYLGRPDLTAEKFIPDMLGTSPGARLYRTGDLGRFLPDGTILFSGRTDRQVKIRGLRVEPGEIEAHLRAHGWVKEAVVDVRPDRLGERQLVAYIIPENTERINIREIREFLSKRLPSSLVPAAFFLRESFPLSPSGKVDLRALPDPGDSDLVGKGVRVPPRTGTEELLAGIWADILGVEGVGREDNFFELGGHSLRVTQLLSRVRQVFSVELPLRAVFETPSLQRLAGEVDKQRNGDGFVVLLPALEAVPRTEEIPLSFSQQRLWFLEQLEPGSPTYNIPASFNVSGPLRLDILRQCVEEMISRHEILRTRFVKRHGQPYQHIEDGMDPPFSDVDLSVLTPKEQQEHIVRTALDESRQCFDLETGPLFRISVLTRGPDDHVILLTMHHIIADGWSIGVMIREMSTLYEAFAAGRPSDLQPPQVQYADFAAWQRTWLSGDIFEMQLSYWKHQLEGMPTFLELPLDRSRPSMQSSVGQTESLEIPSDLRVALEELCQQVGVTMYMLLLTAFGVLLHRYSRQDDFAVGSPIANRRHSQTEDLIGFFVNTLVLRMRFSDSMTVRDLLKSTREMCLDAFAHQDLPFEKIVEALQPARDMGRSPLFQTAFVHQNFPTQSLQISGLTITPFNIEMGTNKFDLTLTTAEMPDGVRADLEYSTALFDQSTAARMLRHFSTILEQFVTDVDQPVGRVPLLKKAELQELLVKRNNSYADFPDNQCVHEWFEAEVERHPHEIALSCDSSEISYRDLNSRANQLARYLRSLGVGPETLVGLCFDRSSEMIIAILGVLKAGGAFVPLDPAYPAERLSHMVRDSKITLVLSHTLVVDRLPENGYRTVLLDREWEVIGKANAENLRLNTSPDSLAYIIYTSGSTGSPKGTMLHHKGLCNLATAQMRTLGVGSGSRILQFASLSFDASVWEFVMALLSGGTLVLAAREELTTGHGVAETLRRERITTITLPPSVLSVIPVQECPHLTTIITAGERCPRELVDRWGKGRTFVNAYGPTETTVCASMHLCVPNNSQDPPIGVPITNVRLYVVDELCQPVPVGVAGELLIGGVGVARGYLGRPDLTAERFIPSPFGPQQGERLYRSGDLCRHLSDGAIEYLGRIDQQVKVRGFRVEPGEIEAALDSHPEVSEAVVIVREDTPGDRRIVAYVVADRERSLSTGNLRHYLGSRLPDYMIPYAFVFLESFPLTPSGKVDRRALPVPDPARRDVESSYVPPRTPVETALAEHCAQLLGLEKVGIRDSFFELGGHSLLATQLMSRIQDHYHVDLPLRTLFETPTIVDLAEKIESAVVAQRPSMNRIEEKLKAIEQLSEAEVNTLLDEMKKTTAGNGVARG